MNLSTVMLIILLEAIILSLAAVGVITWWLARRSKQAQQPAAAPTSVAEALTLPEDLHAQTRQYLEDELERTRALRLGPASQMPIPAEVLDVRLIALEAELKALDVASQPELAWRRLAQELTPLCKELDDAPGGATGQPGNREGR